MDRTDRRILTILQQDSSLPVAEVAARVNLSQTPCWRRIQKLEREGVIDRRVALLDPDAIGLGISVFVEIESVDHSPEWLAAFGEAVADMPEVMEVYRMAGDVDYLLRVAVGSMADYDDFYRRLIAAIGCRNVTSRFAMERVKFTPPTRSPTRTRKRRPRREGPGARIPLQPRETAAAGEEAIANCRPCSS